VIRVVLITDRATCPVPEMLARLRDILAAVPQNQLRIQIRDRHLDGGPLLGLTREVQAIAGDAEVWVNDRVDVALAAGAHGVHLPEHGLAIADARALAGSRLAIGCSRHAAATAREAAQAGADAVQLGPIWSTPSKLGLIEPLGPDVLASRLGVPLIAIGGIDSPQRAREAVCAGAGAVAVIRAAWTSSDPGATIAALCEAVESAARPSGGS